MKIKRGKGPAIYQDEFDYLISAGIALEVNAISQPTYPLVQNAGKSLLKLYMNDTGIFTGLLYNNNIMPVLSDQCGVNLGAVYENAVAQELKAHGFSLYYYDNKKAGEVDYLIDDNVNLSTTLLEFKFGKDYKEHSALDRFLSNPDYRIKQAFVLSNERKVYTEGGVTYLPVYYVMFLQFESEAVETFF